MSHTTHFDDCGCLTARYEARIATLEAELAASREDAKLAWAEAAMGPTEAAITHELAKLQAHANALRDALEVLRSSVVPVVGSATMYAVGVEALDRAATLLAQTPAASLAAAKDSLRSHDAEVLERAACICDEARAVAAGRTGDPSTIKGAMYEVVECVAAECADRIRALAAQAATHSELEVKP